MLQSLFLVHLAIFVHFASRFAYIFNSVEELQESLKLFEAVLPRYFHGAITIQSQGEEKIKNDTFTLNKKSLSEESATFLREKTSISLEYDLYNFVASRFSEMKSQYGIS